MKDDKLTPLFIAGKNTFSIACIRQVGKPPASHHFVDRLQR
jgi:hypothetical protein